MKRTSKTRSDSRGTPYLKPKLMSWRAMRPDSSEAPSAAKIRSRSWRPERSEVSMMTSACSRTSSRMRRSSTIEAAIPARPSSGWRGRVSLKRRMSTSSRASRKKTCGAMPRPSSAPRTAPSATRGSPDRTSRTMATRSKRPGSDATSCGRSGIAGGGAPARPAEHEDRQLVQAVHDGRHDERADRVAARRHDYGEDDDAQDDVASAALEALHGQQADAVEHDDDDGELHDRAEGQEQHGHEAEVGLRGERRLQHSPGLEAAQERRRGGQDGVGDTDAEQEEDDHERHPGSGDASFVGRQAGRDERPELPG